MFKKLRIKFIALIMCSVAVVLTVVFVGICINEYRSNLADVDEALTQALDSSAMGGNDDNRLGIPPWEQSGVSSSSWGPQLQSGSASMTSPRIGGREKRGFPSIVPVATFELDGTELTAVPGATSASLSSDVLEQAATEIAAAPEGNGTLDDLGLRYAKRVTGEGTYVAFADTTYIDSWQSLAVSLTLGGLVVLAIFFVLSLFFSNWALKPVREAWDSQRQFIADASHELKTPLTVVLANSSILLKHPQDSIASQSQWVESTQVEAERMQQLVNEMLQLAQVEERAALELSSLDFSDLVDGEVLQFESVAFEEGLQFDSEIEEGVMVDGDATRLGKMVSTLIENALKYAGEGGTATVSLARSERFAVLAITNSGTTIAPEDLPHIFDRFYRTDKARTSGEGGFGLGLAIAREIARAHGGDIACKSDADSGTTFTVTIPLSSK